MDDIITNLLGRIALDYNRLKSSNTATHLEIVAAFMRVFKEAEAFMTGQPLQSLCPADTLLDTGRQSNGIKDADELNFESLFPGLMDSSPMTDTIDTGDMLSGSDIPSLQQDKDGQHNVSQSNESPRVLVTINKRRKREISRPNSKSSPAIDMYPTASQVTSISDMVRKRIGADHRSYKVVIGLAVEFASPAIVSDLINILECRQKDGLFILASKGCVPTTTGLMEALDGLEVHIRTAFIARRFCLVQLRERYENEIKNQKGYQVQGIGRGNVRARALNAMVRETIELTSAATVGERSNGIDETTTRIRLKNRLSTGKLYHKLCENFSLGALAMLPSGLSNSAIENLSEECRDVLIDALLQFRGPYLQRLCEEVFTIVEVAKSGVSWDQAAKIRLKGLRDESYDSETLIRGLQITHGRT